MQIKDLTGGLVRNISPDSLAPTQVQDAQNVTFSEMLGVVKTRRGMTQYGSLTYLGASNIFWQSVFSTPGIVVYGTFPPQYAYGGPFLWDGSRLIQHRLFTTNEEWTFGGGFGGSLSNYATGLVSFAEYGNWLLFCDGNRNYKYGENMGCKLLAACTFLWEYDYVSGALSWQANFGPFIFASTGDVTTSQFWCSYIWEKQQIEGETITAGEALAVTEIDAEQDSDARALSFPVLLGVRPPALGTTVALSGAGDLSGTYTYKVTFVNEAGFESNGSTATSPISPSGHQVALNNIPVGTDGNIAKRRIYRIENGGATYKRVDEIDNNYETTYTDNVEDVNLGVAIPEVNGYPPPFIAMTAHRSLMWGIRAIYPDEVWYCNAKSEWEYFDIYNYEEFGEVPQNSRALVSFGAYLVILQNVDVFLYDMTQQPAVTAKVLAGRGPANMLACFNDGSNIIIGSILGVFSFVGAAAAATDITKALKPIFDTDSDDSLRIDEDYLSNMRVVAFGDDILVSYTSTGQTANDKTLWIKKDSGIVEGLITTGFTDLTIDRELGNFYGLKSDYKVYQLLSGDDDDGTDIDWYFQTKDFAVEYGSIVNAKEGLKAKIDCNPNGGTITVDVYMDGSSVQTRTITGSSRTAARWRLPDRTFHRISYKVSGSGKQYFYGLVDNIVSGDM